LNAAIAESVEPYIQKTFSSQREQTGEKTVAGVLGALTLLKEVTCTRDKKVNAKLCELNDGNSALVSLNF